MNKPTLSIYTRILAAFAALAATFLISVMFLRSLSNDRTSSLSDLRIMLHLFLLPILAAFFTFAATKSAAAPVIDSSNTTAVSKSGFQNKPFTAQVVGLRWLNPLQRRDYSTEWQLLWTLGLAKPNPGDDLLKTKPEKYAKIGRIGLIANDSTDKSGHPSFIGFHRQYMNEAITKLHDNYFSSSENFYNVHTTNTDKWRELAGIHVEYSLPDSRAESIGLADVLAKNIISTFSIGYADAPTLWTRSTPPDAHATLGGANAGFTSLSAALAYLQGHPAETAWVMSFDAPSFPDVGKINENMVLLVLAGPDYDTGRRALAWVGYPVTRALADFAPAKKDEQPRAVRAWKATIEAAAQVAGKRMEDIGYVVFDAGNGSQAASDRLGPLAQTLTEELADFRFLEQTFNTPALLGEMGASTALTNVALAIAYANHVGRNVLVAGTTNPENPSAVMVVPPAEVQPIDPNQDWFRARSGAQVFLPWWGMRNGVEPLLQGYSD